MGQNKVLFNVGKYKKRKLEKRIIILIKNTTKMEKFTVEISIKDSVLAWEIINDQFRNSINTSLSNSTEIVFINEEDAGAFVEIISKKGCEVWSEDISSLFFIM